MTTLIYRWENCGAVANGKAGNQTAMFLTTAQHCLPGLLCLGLSSLLFGAPDLEVREKSWLLHPFLGDSVQWFSGTEIGVALLRTSGLKQSFAAWYTLREMHCKPWLIPSCLSLAPGSVLVLWMQFHWGEFIDTASLVMQDKEHSLGETSSHRSDLFCFSFAKAAFPNFHNHCCSNNLQ